MANEFKVRKALQVDGNATVNGNADINGDADISGDLNIGGDIVGSPSVSGDLAVGQDLHVVQNMDVDGNANVDGNAVIDGDLTVNGSFSFAGGSVFPDNTFEVQDEGDATKAMGMSLGSAATGTKTTLGFAQTANRSIAFPDASTTVVGHDATQTLSNKKLLSDTVAVADASDPTKLVGVNAAAVSPATQRNIIMPDADVDLGGLTNSNISGAASIARSKIAAGAPSEIVVNNGSGNLSSTPSLARALIAPGTASHVLVNDGSGNVSSEASLAVSRGGTSQTGYTQGDILYASATNTLSKLPIGTIGQSLKVDESGLPYWDDITNPSREMRMVEDWNTDATGQLRWLGIVGGAGAASTTTLAYNNANTHGVVVLSSGTTATGFSHRTLGGVTTGAFTSGVQAGGGIIVMEHRVMVPVLSTVVQEFNTRFGLLNAYTGVTDSITAHYSRVAYGANWQLNTIAASTTTTTDTGIPVVAGQWYKFRFEINAAASEVKLYINGVLVATSTTNIPSGVNLAPTLMINSTVGTTSKDVAHDYFRFYKRFTSAR